MCAGREVVVDCCEVVLFLLKFGCATEFSVVFGCDNANLKFR